MNSKQIAINEQQGSPQSLPALPFVYSFFSRQTSRLQVALSQVFHKFLSECTTTLPKEGTEGASSTPSPPRAHDDLHDPSESKSSEMATTSNPLMLPREGVQAWLLKINRSLGRGSEFRSAEACMEQGSGDGLTLAGEYGGIA